MLKLRFSLVVRPRNAQDVQSVMPQERIRRVDVLAEGRQAHGQIEPGGRVEDP